MRYVARNSFVSITVMRIVLVLVSSDEGGSEVTGRSGVGSCGQVDQTFLGRAWHGILLSPGFLEGPLLLSLL